VAEVATWQTAEAGQEIKGDPAFYCILWYPSVFQAIPFTGRPWSLPGLRLVSQWRWPLAN